MENGSCPRRREIPSPHASSPNSSTTTSSSNGSSLPTKVAPLAVPAAAPTTPKSIPRPIDPNPYPTTFIQADTTSFKQVVQMLTGSTETAAKQTAAAAAKTSIPPTGKATGPKKPAFKLYERRGSMKNLKMISPMIPSFAGRSNPNSPTAAAFSPRKMPEILSPSILDLPSLDLSPVTPLIPDPFDRDVLKAEERAIAEKGFYFPLPRGRRLSLRDCFLCFQFRAKKFSFLLLLDHESALGAMELVVMSLLLSPTLSLVLVLRRRLLYPEKKGLSCHLIDL